MDFGLVVTRISCSEFCKKLLFLTMKLTSAAGWSSSAIFSRAQNSFFPMSITTLSSISSCDLCIVTAQDSFNGNWRREHELPEDDQDLRSGVMGTTPSKRVGQEREGFGQSCSRSLELFLWHH